MPNIRNLALYKSIIYASIIITLVATPNFNKDALIIPKVILLFCLALFILPYLSKIHKFNKTKKLIKILELLLILITLQLILVITFSEAPIEQQIFGRTGRGMGLITLLSIVVVIIICALLAEESALKILVFGLMLSGSLSAIYALFQSFGLDFAPWDSKTNGVIGTLGNPNFVSSFAAMAIMPALVFVSNKGKHKIYQMVFGIIFVFTIYRAQSYQGYITLIIAFGIFLLLYLFYKNRVIFVGALFVFLVGIVVAVAGSLNKGPLASYLYKVSVQSRGEFWRSAFNTVNAHPIFGVGLDSFGDYSLMYRDRAVINEYTDSAHNYFLDFSAMGGYLLAILYLSVIIITLLSFIKLQKHYKKFDSILAAIFSTFIVFQAQSLISPICIPLITWSAVISGSIIGLAANFEPGGDFLNKKPAMKFSLAPVVTTILGIIIVFPYFNSDRLQLNAMNKGDGDLAMKVAKMYPESVVRYSVLTRALLDSGLTAPALDMAHSAVNFNPNSPALWALILINPSASIEERKSAKEKLLNLDPLNEELINYKI